MGIYYIRRKPPTCFGHLLWQSSGSFTTKDILQGPHKPMHRYKILSFKLVRCRLQILQRHPTRIVLEHKQQKDTPLLKLF